MDDKQIRYIPFNAINEFMLPEFRHIVIQTVLRDIEKLDGGRRRTLNNLITRYVAVPGFRNSAQAPVAVKVKGATTTFERRPEFTAQMLQSWAELHAELREAVYQMLKARNWEALLPPDADRSKLPGFMVTWPKEETYDVIDAAFKEANPDFETTDNDVRLMAVWLVNRLPYDLFADEGNEADEVDEAEA
jgi:hypothetical protein